MTSLAITVLGHDRPGIIAETTARLADLGLNLEDSSMTRLRGHFAMTLVCAGSAEVGDGEAALSGLSSDGTLTVSVLAVPEESALPSPGTPWVLTVHGADPPGIVSSVVAEVAQVGANITDLTTRLTGDLYVLVAEIDLPLSVDVAALEAAIGDAATRLGVGATLRQAEADDL